MNDNSMLSYHQAMLNSLCSRVRRDPSIVSIVTRTTLRMDPERSEPPESEFEILTSIRCGGIVDSCIENNDFGYHSLEKTKYYMFRYHRDRMLAAAQAFGWDKVAAMLRDDAGMEFIDRILESHINEKLGYQISETPLKVSRPLSGHG